MSDQKKNPDASDKRGQKFGPKSKLRSQKGRPFNYIFLIALVILAMTFLNTGLSGSKINWTEFEDHLENGLMKFDYALRDGVVEKSNALELMRSIGLDV